MGQNSAKPQVVFSPPLPGGPGGLGDQAAMAYAQGARGPQEIAVQMVKNDIFGIVFGLAVLAIVALVFWYMGKPLPTPHKTEKFGGAEACITTLEQNTENDTWEGTAIRTGQVKVFKTLEDYKQYISNMENEGTYCPPVDPQYHNKYTAPKKDTTPSGFLEFAVRDPAKQAKYDALSPSWEGIDSTNKAIARGDFSLDSAEATRKELREDLPPPKSRPQPVWNIVTH